MDRDIRVRFAPSPTGLLHLGGVRTALYNYLFAKQNAGTFVLRIEDTDRSRYVEGSVKNLTDSLQELGIVYTEGPYFQSERLDIYHKHVNELIERGLAYRCYCSKAELEEMRNEQSRNGETTKYNGKCRESLDSGIRESEFVVRMKIPQNRVFEFNDLVRGDIRISSDDIEDQVILKADGFPTYHLAAVVDDHYMNISHVLRGEEWLYSTPKHVFLYEAFGWEQPIWVHLPLLLNTDKSKLSKRHGDFSVANYLSSGYLKEAIINFVALLGWHSSEDREFYSLEELKKEFSLERITKSGAVFDITKLDWMNGWYLRNLPLEYVAELCKPYFVEKNVDISDETKYLKVINRARDQIVKLPDILEHSQVFYKEIEVSEENTEILRKEDSQKVLKWMIAELENVEISTASQTSNETIEPHIEEKEAQLVTLLKRASEELGIKGKNLFFPIRIALFGECHGPDIPLLMDIYGISESVKRLRKYVFD